MLSKISVIIIAFTILFAIACNKDIQEPSVSRVSESRDCASFVSEEGIWGNLLDKNESHQTINRVNFHFAQATRQVMQNEEFAKQIFTQIQSSDIEEVDIIELCAKNSELSEYYNEALSSSLKLYPSNDLQTKESVNFIDFLASKLQDDEKYRPVIYSVKKITSFGLSPIIAIPVGNACGYVPAWNDKGEEVLLSEGEVMKSSNTVLFVGHGDKQAITYDMVVNPIKNSSYATESSERSMPNVDIRFVRWQINNGFGFGNENRSQVNCAWKLLSKDQGVSYIPGFSTPVLESFAFLLANISDTDVSASKMFTSISSPFNANAVTMIKGLSVSTFADRELFYVVYEEDWYASYKTISNDCAPTLQQSQQLGRAIGTRRNFAGDVYVKTCGNATTLFPTPPGGIGSPSINVINSNNKCLFDINSSIM